LGRGRASRLRRTGWRRWGVALPVEVFGELVELLGGDAQGLGAVLTNVRDNDVIHVGDEVAYVIFNALGGLLEAILPRWALPGGVRFTGIATKIERTHAALSTFEYEDAG